MPARSRALGRLSVFQARGASLPGIRAAFLAFAFQSFNRSHFLSFDAWMVISRLTRAVCSHAAPSPTVTPAYDQ